MLGSAATSQVLASAEAVSWAAGASATSHVVACACSSATGASATSHVVVSALASSSASI